MGLVQYRRMASMLQATGLWFPRGLAKAAIVLGVLVSAAAGVGTASAMHDRTASLADIDHRVIATVTVLQRHIANRLGSEPALLRWTYPAGTIHVEQTDVLPAYTPRTQMLWVDASGCRTAGPPGNPTIVATAAWVTLRTLLLTAMVLAVAACVLAAWVRVRLRSAFDTQWVNLVHHLWEDL
jgi:hypothetical protein